jgi:hypothetical protein
MSGQRGGVAAPHLGAPCSLYSGAFRDLKRYWKRAKLNACGIECHHEDGARNRTPEADEDCRQHNQAYPPPFHRSLPLHGYDLSQSAGPRAIISAP